jgi:hypothetical protein
VVLDLSQKDAESNELEGGSARVKSGRTITYRPQTQRFNKNANRYFI